MVRSPRSRGKGGRRYPGRPGGKGPTRPADEWRRRATHAAARAVDLAGEHRRVWFCGGWGLSVSELVYRVDQALAKDGVPYYPVDYHGWHTGLEVLVPSGFVAIAEGIRPLVERVPDRVRPARETGRLARVEPLRLPRQLAAHPWLFQSYSEVLPDGDRHVAFLFRDDERRQFGIREWILPATGAESPVGSFPKLAWRVVTDPSFRRELISDDPALRDYWR